MDAINEFFGKVQDWVISQGNNQLFWIIMFFGGVGVFLLTYSALHRNQ